MRIQYGKLYQYHEYLQPVDFMVLTKNGWRMFPVSTMFIILRKEKYQNGTKNHYVVLLPNGDTGELYTRSTRLKLAEP